MLEQSLKLLFSGMLTVFTVLGLVVLMGRLLIYVVNTFSSPPLPVNKLLSTIPSDSTPPVSAETLAVIAAAVEVATAGTGQIKEIELLPQEDDLSL